MWVHATWVCIQIEEPESYYFPCGWNRRRANNAHSFTSLHIHCQTSFQGFAIPTTTHTDTYTLLNKHWHIPLWCTTPRHTHTHTHGLISQSRTRMRGVDAEQKVQSLFYLSKSMKRLSAKSISIHLIIFCINNLNLYRNLSIIKQNTQVKHTWENRHRGALLRN